MNQGKKKYTRVDKVAFWMTRWAGTSASIIAHTLVFMGALALVLFGVNVDRVMLVLTTAVSLEAIYLSLFIQMTVNRHEKKIRDVHDDIEDIAEDIEDLVDDEKAV